MRIDELKRIAEENDYKFHDEYGLITISRISLDYENIVEIDKDKLNCLWIHNSCCDDKDLKTIKAAIEYAETDPEDREEEKKFLIQHKFLVSVGSNPVNLVKYKDKNNYRAIRCLFDNQFYQAHFTLKEIEEIKKKFDTDLKDFELVELVE